DALEFEQTDSVLEALILEAELIKKFQPYYNVKEKDDKSWNYVLITKEEFPRVIIVRGKELKEASGVTYVLDDTGTRFRNLLFRKQAHCEPPKEKGKFKKTT